MSLLLLLAGILVAPDSVVAESVRTVTVSLRVGPEIDAAERGRFHMLPGFPGFVQAVFRQHADSSLTIDVTRGRARGDTVETFRVRPEQFRRIGSYLDRHDMAVRDLAALPDGAVQYQSLWQGIGLQPDSLELATRSGPTESPDERRVMGGIVGAACGLGLGSTVGALAGISFSETRRESIYVTPGCGSAYWERYVVDIYDLNQFAYGFASSAGAMGGAAAGWFHGGNADQARIRRAMGSRGITGYDLFGEPILQTEVSERMPSGNRSVLTFLGASGGWVGGVGLGLLATAIVRSIVFKPTPNDSIVVRNGAFALAIPLIAISLGAAIEGGYLGYRRGRALDWEAGFKQAWNNRVQAALLEERRQ